MCDTLVASRAGPVRSRSTEILSTGNMSIVVEGVDGEPPDVNDEDEEPVFLHPEESIDISEGGTESLISSPRGSRRSSRRGSKSSTKEETETKLAFFKTEAAARLSELERLLDEHDQIIRELKRSESNGGLNVMKNSFTGSGFFSVPTPATPEEGNYQKTPSIVISKTAPSSPDLSKRSRPPE